MLGRLALCLVLVAPAASAQDWVEVTSPHFEVYSDAGIRDATRVARELEIVRSVFQAALPTTSSDPALPLVVIALDDSDDIPVLFPQLRDGAASVTGVFRSSAFEHHIVVALDGGGRERYQVVYHEYFHLLSTLTSGGLPPWLTEGLAEVYSNLTVRGDRVEIGDPRLDYLNFLSRERLLPLDVLVASGIRPHSAGDFEATRFYAQSWALTHYLLLGDKSRSGQTLVEDYMVRIRQGDDSRDAFEQAIGPLDEVTRALGRYLRRDAFYGLRMDAPPAVDEESFTVRLLTNAEAWSVQAGVVAQGTQPQEAQSLAERALAANPKSARARESIGLMHAQRGDTYQAVAAFRQAIDLGSDRFLPYYLAARLMIESGRAGPGDHVRHWLRQAIDIRPQFAGAYTLLAGLLVDADPMSSEARQLTRRAVELEPTVVHHWVALAEILLAQNDIEDARAVVAEATPWIRSPQDQARLRAVGTRTRSAEAVFARAQVLRAAGSLNAAAAAYRDTVRLDPRNAAAFNGLGWTLFDLGRLDESAAAHRAAIEIDPMDTDAHHALGVILVKQGALDEAEASFRRAISRDR